MKKLILVISLLTISNCILKAQDKAIVTQTTTAGTSSSGSSNSSTTGNSGTSETTKKKGCCKKKKKAKAIKHQSENQTQLDSIKAVRDKEKFK